MKMTKANISDYCMRNGVLVYEKYDEKDFSNYIDPCFSDLYDADERVRSRG